MSDLDIRGALQARLATVVGLPEIAYEGVQFEPPIGTDGDLLPYVVPVIVVGSERPFDVLGEAVSSQGTFEISCVYPSNEGTAAVEGMAEAIKAVFVNGTRLVLGSAVVKIRWAERRQAFFDADYVRVPVSIGWRVN